MQKTPFVYGKFLASDAGEEIEKNENGKQWLKKKKKPRQGHNVMLIST
jgi:hypothetical protein